MTTLETSRLLLRDWKAEDLPHLISLRGNPQVMHHFPGIDSPEKVTGYFDEMRQRSHSCGYGFRPVLDKSTRRFMGFCGVKDVNFETGFTPATEIGWSFLPQFWGKGFATEAATRWLDFAFDDLGREQIVSFAVEQNFKSHAVMERLGMTRAPAMDFIHPRVPDTHPELKKHIVYTIGREEWKKKKE